MKENINYICIDYMVEIGISLDTSISFNYSYLEQS